MKSSPSSCYVNDVLRGATGFAAISVLAFSLWAFAGRWFYQNVGEVGLYVAITIVYLGVTGILLHPLVRGGNRLLRFYKAFIPAFIIYAIIWSVCWFVLKSGKGEWLGSLLGCAVFAWVLRKMLGSNSPIFKVVLFMFVTHSLGYFLGGVVYMNKADMPEFLKNALGNQLGLFGMLFWGLLYGLGFGAGIGYAFNRFQIGKQE